MDGDVERQKKRGRRQGPGFQSNIQHGKQAACLEAGVGAKFLKPTQYQQLRVQDVVKPVRR